MKKKLITILLLSTIFFISIFLYTSIKWADYYGLLNEIFQPIEYKPLKKIEQKNINWTQEIEFSQCFSYNKSKQYLANIDVVHLTKKIIENWYAKFYRVEYPKILLEYCHNQEKTKYIFIFNDKIWRYDKLNNILELNDPENSYELRIKSWEHIISENINAWTLDLIENYYEYLDSKFYNQWFWKREGNFIKVNSFWRNITWSNRLWVRDLTKMFLENEKNENYCIQGLTPKWNAPICIANIYYKYDYINNDLFIDRYCTYYFDDFWEIQILEKCRNWVEI